MEVDVGEYIAPEKMKFGEFATEWMEKRVEKELSPSTAASYQSYLKIHLLPVFSHYRLDKIKPIHIINFLDELSKTASKRGETGEIISQNTIVFIHQVLRDILGHAMEWKLIKQNPMETVKKPKVEFKQMKYYEEGEADEVIETLYKEPLMWTVYFTGAMIGGFRLGELLALEWTEVDFEENTITIAKNIPITKKGGIAVIKDPKTEKSARTVVMPEWYMEDLMKYRNEWVTEKERVGDLWEGGDNQFLFHKGFGKPLHHNTPTAAWRRFINKNDFKRIRLHDLRHTMVTFLIEAGVHFKAIQERTGHTTLKVLSETYGHVTKKVNKDTADKFNKFSRNKDRC